MPYVRVAGRSGGRSASSSVGWPEKRGGGCKVQGIAWPTLGMPLLGTVNAASPFMLLTMPLTGLGQRDLAAAAHVDGTTRPQTVCAAVNPRYHRLIRAFQDRTGIGAVLNTSLNVKSEPIANDPVHEITDLCTTAMDALVIEDFVLVKQPSPA